MSVSWTKEQQAAIDSFGRGVTVSAAAGSGKTAVLIERVIKLLTDKEKQIPADRLLAVTFTIDAAAQMRDKLNEAFEKKLAEAPDDKWLLEQQNLVQLARISTIDSFCFDLVKENLDKFEFSGGLKILAEAENELMFSNAFDQAAEELCANDRESYETLDNFFDFENGELETMTEKLYTHLHSVCHSEQWIKRAMEKYESDDFFKDMTEKAFASCDEKLKDAKRALEDARYCFNYTIESGDNSYAMKDHVNAAKGNLEECGIAYLNCEEAVAAKDIDRLIKVNKPVTKANKLSGKNKMPNDICAVLDDVRARFAEDIKSVKEIIAEIISCFGVSKKHLRENLSLSNRIFEKLCTLEKRTEEILFEMKLEKNAVDFSDIELMAKSLLVTETEDGFERTQLAEEIRSAQLYRIILIDEYQDVNDIQEIIFKAVSDTDDLNIMGKNTFIVGDMKQAIYGFRKTNPKLFKKCINAACDEKNTEVLEHIRLKKNFRSRKEVLGLSNFIFSTIMSDGCGEVDYNDDERLELGASYTDRRCPAEVMLITDTEDIKCRPFSEELYQVALRIKSLIDAHSPVCEKGGDRPCRQSDFCILVNTNENIKEAAEALKAVGLQAFCEDTQGYIRSREISLALNMLRAVDNPMNDIAVTAVMMSPIMSFTPDEMLTVREKCKIEKSKKLNHIYQVLSGAAREKGTDEKYAKYIDMGSELLQEKCKSAYELIESLRYCSMSMSLERLIRRIYDVTDLMAITSLYLDSEKKRANLRLLLEYAHEYENSGNEGVTGFLRFVDSVSGNDKAFKNAVSVTSGSDSVNVKTYHKSKGLEFPFVFLCTLSKNLIRNDGQKERLKLHREPFYAFEIKDKSLYVRRKNLYCDHLSNILDNETKSERMRLFYVGCTRAKEKLILVCTIEKQGNKKAENVKADLCRVAEKASKFDRIPAQTVLAQDSMLAWTVMCLSKLEYRQPLEEWLGMDMSTFPVSPRSIEADVEYYVPQSELKDEVELETETSDMGAPADFIKVKELKEKYRFAQRRPEHMLPSKMSVTEIVQAEKEKKLGDKNPEFFPNLPRLSDELDKLTSAEKGTFTHKFMELADYDKALVSVKDELKRLTEEGFFTKKEADGVYVNRIEAFMQSDFFKRMKASPDLRREQKFLASVNDLKLENDLKEYAGKESFIQGIADCIFKEDDGWVLVDYKTDNFQSTEDMKKYGMQLKLYKAAFELIYGERVKSSYIYSFKLGEGLEFDL